VDHFPRKPSERGDASENGDTPVTWGASGPANTRRQRPGAYEETAPLATPPPPATRAGISPRAALAIALVASVAAGVVSAVAVAGLVSDDDAPTGGTGTVQPLIVEQTSAIADAAARARPSVVRVESTRNVQGGVERDTGSGVILDTEGHVVTNAHVVIGTDSLKVFLADGSERPAILIGHDYPFSDVAVLQIGPGRLQPLEQGDASLLRPGETIIAIGNPLSEYEGSVSVGVVSGTGRARMIDGVRQTDWIQTDAAINHGNSGGALVNLKGQFVGMPTSVIRESRSGNDVEGIAFALPSNRVLEVALAMIEQGGPIPRPSLQAEHLDLTPEVLARLSQPAAKQGALIGAVLPGGAAAEAGLQRGDIITQVGDYQLSPELPLLNALMNYRPGDAVRVVFNRSGRIIETEVRFAQRS